MHRRVRWLVDQARIHGAVGAARVVGRRLAGREYLVHARDLQVPLPPIPAAGISLTCRSITSGDLSLLPDLDPVLTEVEVRRRWREGQHGLLYLVDGIPAYHCWDTKSSAFIPELGVVLRLQDGDWYWGDVYTHPAFRGQGIAGVTAIALLHRAKEQGCRRMLALTAPHNVRSLRTTQQRAGYRVIGRVGYWGVGPFRRYFTTGAVRLRRGSLEVPAAGETPS